LNGGRVHHDHHDAALISDSSPGPQSLSVHARPGDARSGHTLNI
jgi:hypothetical protein